MNDNLYEALEVCLTALETGADIESALMRYPEMADELRPLLEASVRARSLASSAVPTEAMRRGRAKLLQHAAGMREAQAKPRRPVFVFRRLATALALALVVFMSGNGLVSASNGALPGDNLYPVKRTWEDVRLALVINPESREELETEFEQERLEEVDELLSEGRHATISFAGIVTQQDGNQWIVSGIPVQILDTSQLPVDPIEVGMFVMVDGLTNKQGFVEADNIKLLDFIGFLTPDAPVEPSETFEAEPQEDLETEIQGSETQESEMQDSDSSSREKIEGESISNDENNSESIETDSQDKSDDGDKKDSESSDGGEDGDQSSSSEDNNVEQHSD